MQKLSNGYTKKDRRHYRNTFNYSCCKLWDNCLTCPAPDCIWDFGMSRGRQAQIIKTWEPIFERAREAKEDAE